MGIACMVLKELFGLIVWRSRCLDVDRLNRQKMSICGSSMLISEHATWSSLQHEVRRLTIIYPAAESFTRTGGIFSKLRSLL